MSTEVKTTEAATPDPIQVKRAAWADMGEKVYTTEMNLQVRAQAAIQKVKMPVNATELPAARENLKILKAERAAIMADRLAITSTFDKLANRMMNSEKSLDPVITDLNNKIITVTKEYERLEFIKKEKADEVVRIKEKIKITRNERDIEYRKRISTQVTVALQQALEKGVKPEDISRHIEACKGWLGPADFHDDKPSFAIKHIDPLELDQILQDTWFVNPHAYADIYYKELEDKFADYSIAYANKQDALALAQKEHEAREKALETERANKDAAAKLESNATPLIGGLFGGSAHVKALKKTYEIDMPETVDNAIAIMAAFVANKDECLKKLRLQKWFTISPIQMGKALAAVKCDYNDFQPAGITFKAGDKL